MPGIVHPDDVEMNETYLTNMISNKGYAIDCWEGNPFNDDRDIGAVYYLRPKTIKAPAQVFDFSWGGQCTFLEQNGCTLDWDTRPAQCRALVPSENHNCRIVEGRYSKKEIVKSWFPYSDLLREVGHKIIEQENE